MGIGVFGRGFEGFGCCVLVVQFVVYGFSLSYVMIHKCFFSLLNF